MKKASPAYALPHVALFGVFAAACGAPFRAATEYSGDSRPRRLAAAEIPLLAAFPADAMALGWVRASCSTRTPTEEQSVWLSDLDCSRVRLTRALLERASAVGADVAAERECEGDEGELECSVLAGRTVQRDPGTIAASVPVSGPHADGAKLLREEGLDRSAWLDEPEPHLAWRMRVRFTPRIESGTTPRATQREARLVEHRSVDQVHLGDLAVGCEGGCSKAAVIEGVRVAARRLGADEVAEVRCSRTGPGQLCVGELGIERNAQD